MKIIMYHYVREERATLPNLKFLNIENFRHQLDYFQREFHFPDADRLLHGLPNGDLPERSAVLTFDDGFSDHYHYVFPELRKRGICGLFFPAAAPYHDQRLLDVHLLHMMAARHRHDVLLEGLREILDDQMLDAQYNELFLSQPYRFQNDEDGLKEFKRILNYYIRYEWKEYVIDRLAEKFLADVTDLFTGFYLSEEQMREMHHGGMVFGGHSVNHRVLSRLSAGEQKEEIMGSFSFLEAILGPLPVRTFCFPYGGNHTFTEETIELLRHAECQLAFSVEPRDVEIQDLLDQPLSLPRYDCTMFPHGLSYTV